MGWKFQLNAVFVAHDIADIIEGTRVRPAGKGGNVKAWIKDNAKAKFLMSSAMEYSQLVCLLSCTTAREMWTRLTSIHEQKSESHKLLLSQKFHEYKMDPNDSVSQHIAQVQNMARQLLDLGQNLPDIQVIAKILASLPSKF